MNLHVDCCVLNMCLWLVCLPSFAKVDFSICFTNMSRGICLLIQFLRIIPLLLYDAVPVFVSKTRRKRDLSIAAKEYKMFSEEYEE